MRVFVTGATGFIGSHVVNELIRRGHEVSALRRPGAKPRIPLVRDPHWLDSPMDGLPDGCFRGCDALVHLAAHSANVPYDSLENCLYWNLRVSLDLVKQADAEGLGRFLVAGSCFEYGRSGERYEFIPTDAPLEPTQTYPISKAAAAVALMGWARMAGRRLSYHRIFQVFGEGEAEGRLWPSLRRAAAAGEDFPMSPGGQIRDFTPVDLVARHFADALEAPAPPAGQPEIRHVGTGKPRTTLDFAQEWWSRWSASGKLLPGAIPYREGEVMRYVPLIA
jgi:nucleoside-diphosphate-sugar epimerase